MNYFLKTGNYFENPKSKH